MKGGENLQGASILATGKVYENDIGRNSYPSANTASKTDTFRDCLRRQSPLVNSSNSDTAASTGQAESKAGKLDRSALLRTPSTKNSKTSKNTGNDTSNGEAGVVELDTADTAFTTGCSAVPTQPQANPDAGNTSDDTTVDQAVIQALLPENKPTAGSTLAVEVIESLGKQAVQAGPEQEAGDLFMIDSSITNNQAAAEAEPVQEVERNTQTGPVKDALNRGEQLTAEMMPEGNQSNLQPELTDLTGQIDSSSDKMVRAISPGQAAATLEQTSQESSPQTAGENDQASKDSASAADVEVQIPVPKVGTDVQNLLAAQPEANPLPAPKAPNTLATADVQSLAAQEASIEIPEATFGSSNLVEGASAGVEAKGPGSVKAEKGGAKDARTEAKADNTGSKASLEVFKAIAGKLEETDPGSTTQGDKKENTGSGELKKLMEFESNRLQAVPLKENSDTSKTSTAEKPAVVTVTPGAEMTGISDVNKTLATNFSDKSPIDVKNLIDQVVQKAELTVKANSSEMKIQLEPQLLGKLTIKIALEDGLLTARFTTDNHQVKHLLESNMSTLRQSLEAQGIKVEKTEVNVQLDSGGTFGGYQEGRQEMWQRPETPNYQNSSYAAGGYELTGEEDLIEPAFSQTDYYGIQADGSMNFIV